MTNQDIVKGSALMVFLGGSAIGFATSHALNLTTNTTEVVCPINLMVAVVSAD